MPQGSVLCPLFFDFSNLTNSSNEWLGDGVKCFGNSAAFDLQNFLWLDTRLIVDCQTWQSLSGLLTGSFNVFHITCRKTKFYEDVHQVQRSHSCAHVLVWSWSNRRRQFKQRASYSNHNRESQPVTLPPGISLQIFSGRRMFLCSSSFGVRTCVLVWSPHFSGKFLFFGVTKNSRNLKRFTWRSWGLLNSLHSNNEGKKMISSKLSRLCDCPQKQL